MTMFAFVWGPADDTQEAAAKARRAFRLCLDSATEVGRLTALHKTLYGITRLPIVNLQWITIALYVFLADLDDQEHRAAFIELCICARALARRWRFAMGVLRMIQLNAKKLHKNLPDETVRLFEDFETEFWSSGEEVKFSSKYPDFASAISHHATDEETESLDMDSFLRKWNRTDLLLQAHDVQAFGYSGTAGIDGPSEYQHGNLGFRAPHQAADQH
jgi:hypothetical protein